MTAPPPPRYRVEERGRQLLVVDTWANEGRSAPSERPATASAAKSAKPTFGLQRTGFTERELATLAIFDAKGPRRIRIIPNSPALRTTKQAVAVLVFAVVLMAWVMGPMALGVIATAGLLNYRRLRPLVTRWLDALERESG